jgi:hypothetical protein
MNWKKTISYGAVIWVLMFVIVSIFIGFGFYSPTWSKGLIIIIGGIISYIVAKKYARPASSRMAISYGVSWAVVGVILDTIITARFDPTVFQSKTYWVSYLVILLAPLLTVKKGA